MTTHNNQSHSENTLKTTSYVQKLSLMAGSLSALYMLPSAANAAIITNSSSFDVTIQNTLGGSDIEWDIDGGSTTEVSFATFVLGTTVVDIGISNATYSSAFGFGFAPLGFSVGQYFTASNSGIPGASSIVTPSNVFNGFIADGETEYMVFQFADDSDGSIKRGWASLTAFINGDQTTGFTINEWAYESDSSLCIVVGSTTESNNCPPPEPRETTPEPTSALALLSMGAAGVYRWRKRKQLLAQAEKNAA